ncbi:MAG: TlpA family protein disulfide reductase [bacterium]|nr:TlpA family protein disulfide reductase [bacterium]
MSWRSLVGLALILMMATTALAAPKKLPNMTLTDLNGKRHKIEELTGDGPVLINFWATYCKPCLAEMPKLYEFYETQKDAGFTVISISIDPPRSAKQVKPFVRRQGIKFPVYVDTNQEIHRKLGGRAVPYNVLVGTDGMILAVTTGYKESDAEKWAELIAADVAEHGKKGEQGD